MIAINTHSFKQPVHARHPSNTYTLFRITLYIIVIVKLSGATRLPPRDFVMNTKADIELAMWKANSIEATKPLYKISNNIGQRLTSNGYVFNHTFCTCTRVFSDSCLTAVMTVADGEAVAEESFSSMLCVRSPCIKYTCDLTGPFLCRRKATHIFEYDVANTPGNKPAPCKKMLAEREFYYSDV